MSWDKKIKSYKSPIKLQIEQELGVPRKRSSFFDEAYELFGIGAAKKPSTFSDVDYEVLSANHIRLPH